MDYDMYHFTADDGDVPQAFHVSLDESVGSCDDSSDAFSNLPTSKWSYDRGTIPSSDVFARPPEKLSQKKEKFM